MDQKPSQSIQLFLKFLQFLVLVLVIANTYTFIDNVMHTLNHPTSGHTIDVERLSMSNKDPDDDEDIQQLLRSKVKCFNKKLERKVYQKGNFWVVENFIKADHGDLDCHETITYTTNGEYPYLDNLGPVVRKWLAPISLALYCGGEDFQNCVDTLAYIRACRKNVSHARLLRKYLSVHLFFENTQVPPNLSTAYDESKVNCLENPMERKTHRSSSDRFFYINIARNVARDAAITHYILASDIELFPSDNIIPQFMRMIAKSGAVELPHKTVYVLPPFEVTPETIPPKTKQELQLLLEDGLAVRFHKSLCDRCHRIPDPELWQLNSADRDMGIFTSVTRTGEHDFWEPFYIGTNSDPYFDERVPYEGGYNKMVQAYMMCMNNYEYAILNNAFLIHRPGIRTYRTPSPQRNNTLHMLTRVAKQYDFMFGPHYECNMFYSKKKVT